MTYLFQHFLGRISPPLEPFPTLQVLPQRFSLLTFWLFGVFPLGLLIATILLVLLLLLEDLFELPLLLDEDALVLLHLGHALIVLLVLEPAEGLPTLHTCEVPCTPALALAVLVHLVLLQGRIASLTGKYHHFIFNTRCTI